MSFDQSNDPSGVLRQRNMEARVSTLERVAGYGSLGTDSNLDGGGASTLYGMMTAIDGGNP